MRSKTIAALLILFGLASGCSILPQKKVYVAPGQIAEIAKPVTVAVWVRNKETGKVELRKVSALPGWYIGRPKQEGINNGEGSR